MGVRFESESLSDLNRNGCPICPGIRKREGVPVYTVLTNEQLAQMVQKQVKSKAGLKEIEGVGDARVEKYGETLVQLLAAPAKA